MKVSIKHKAASAALALVAAGSLTVAMAPMASAATSCTVTAWSTYSTKTLSTSWSYAGSTAKVTGRNEYQSRSYCGIFQVRSKLTLSAAQGAYTKATNADIRWSNGTHSSTSTFPVVKYSPTNGQTTTVTVGFVNTRYGAQTSRSMTYDY